MTTRIYDFTLNQGETLDLTLYALYSNRLPLDLTDYTVRGKIRINFDDIAPAEEFTCTITDPTNGEIRVQLSATETAALDFTRAYYDIEVESPTGVVSRVIQGKIKLSKEATK